MILAAHQPQFMPWLGYFDKMLRCDSFVLLDNVQFKKNEWQNRNRVLMNGTPSWLTVPVLHRFPQNIDEVEINSSGADWREKHLRTIKQSYCKAPFFEEVFALVSGLYAKRWEKLCPLNIASIELLREALAIKTPLALASVLKLEGASTHRLVDLCLKQGADTYLAGAGGHDYMDLSLFEQAGIKVIFQDYKHPEYAQTVPFVPYLSALDLLFFQGIQKARSFFAK
ncbi:MAG TPA: WbqC family protein [Elusimicrobiales bacterium]|nr:WbqC family protein [Elusimicrobiales bacterium]